MSRLCYEGRCDHCSDVDSDAEIENEIDNLIELGTDSEPEVPQVSPDPDELQAARLILELGQTVQSSGRCSRPPDLQEQGDLGDGKKAAQTSAPQVSSNPQQFPVARQILESWRNALSSERYSPPSSLQKLDDLRDGKQAVQFSGLTVAPEMCSAHDGSFRSDMALEGPASYCGSDGESGRMVLGTPLQIWIIGHSFVHWAALHLAARDTAVFPHPVDVSWLGQQGLRWSGFKGLLTREIARRGVPHILVIHLGGDDFGHLKSVELTRRIELDLAWVHASWPSLLLCWSDIVPRQVWQSFSDGRVVDRSRKKVNSVVARFIRSLGGIRIEHPLIRFQNPGLYMPDGVHLTEEGLGLFIGEIYGSLVSVVSE
ncbi:uncharacterized protein LOC142140804 isoform X2 [Mixophyes fleayi]|uniref:uncharacterized protein LOC142140804 isoform X2 n=1 Tax=Mixophyes fleayi TaxID=3061075 RepID=UPI003F4D953E